MDNQFSQEKLDKFIHFNLDDIALFQKLAGRKSSFEETALNSDLMKLDYPDVIFKYSLLERISALIISFVILFGCALISFQTGTIMVLIIAFPFAFIFNIIFWFAAEKNEMKLTANGVTYNSIEYEWDEIERTMIWSKALFNGRRNSRKFLFYLVLALKNGEIEPLEISYLYFKSEKGTEISRFMFKEHQLISHFVEYFKQKGN